MGQLTWNIKLNYFVYKNNIYNSGTEFLYNGPCEMNGQQIFLNHQCCKFLYSQDKSYFQIGDVICTCHTFDFIKNIVAIIEPPQIKDRDEEVFYFTEDMVLYTIVYIVIMAVGVILNDRITLWLFATVAYVLYMLRNKN